ncbi:WecB/TagA/CpsF family glycosyltransferase [Pseudomonadota bacterium]
MTGKNNLNHLEMLGISIHMSPLEDMVSDAMQAIRGERPQVHFACANPHSLVTAKADNEFKAALDDSDLVVADGTGVTLMARLSSLPVPSRITGHDFFTGLLDALNKQGKSRIFFFGSSDNVLQLITERFSSIYPNLEIAGVYSPPYRSWSQEENDEMIGIINDAHADILWVGMTAPKQEKWVFNNRTALNTPVIGSIGAVFDFVAGTHPRAPDWMGTCGIEWLYRLVREPKRMWQRNMISTPKFILSVLKERLLS